MIPTRTGQQCSTGVFVRYVFQKDSVQSVVVPHSNFTEYENFPDAPLGIAIESNQVPETSNNNGAFNTQLVDAHPYNSITSTPINGVLGWYVPSIDEVKMIAKFILNDLFSHRTCNDWFLNPRNRTHNLQRIASSTFRHNRHVDKNLVLAYNVRCNSLIERFPVSPTRFIPMRSETVVSLPVS